MKVGEHCLSVLEEDGEAGNTALGWIAMSSAVVATMPGGGSQLDGVGPSDRVPDQRPAKARTTNPATIIGQVSVFRR